MLNNSRRKEGQQGYVSVFGNRATPVNRASRSGENHCRTLTWHATRESQSEEPPRDARSGEWGILKKIQDQKTHVLNRPPPLL